MNNPIRLLAVGLLLFAAGALFAGERFDGTWTTKLTCPPKGKHAGLYMGVSRHHSEHFRGEHGTAGEPGYLILTGKIADDGNAKLSASEVVASRQYARGVFAHKGEDYNYDVKHSSRKRRVPERGTRGWESWAVHASSNSKRLRMQRRSQVTESPSHRSFGLSEPRHPLTARYTSPKR